VVLLRTWWENIGGEQQYPSAPNPKETRLVAPPSAPSLLFV